MPKAKRDGNTGQGDRPYTRVPVRLSPQEHERLRIFCIRAGVALETIAGQWIAERLAAEEKKLSR